MLIDTIIIALLAIALFKGYRKGLILGIFSLLAIVVGLAAAVKLSTLVAGYLGKNVNITGKWLAVLSFALVFILVIFLIRLGAKALEKTASIMMLGWVNRLGGILLFAIFYLVVFSVCLFYAEHIELIKQDTLQQSYFYSFVQPWGPKAINSLGTALPWFKGMFSQLQDFFGNVATQIEA